MKSWYSSRRTFLRTSLVASALAVLGLIVGLAGSGSEAQDGLILRNDSYVVEVRARSSVGVEDIALELNGRQVARWDDLSTNWTTLTYRVDSPVVVERFRLVFDNDGRHEGRDRNVAADWVQVNGQRFETEAPSTLSRGSWSNVDGCAEGYKTSEQIACNGWMEFTTLQGVVIGRPDRPVLPAPEDPTRRPSVPTLPERPDLPERPETPEQPDVPEQPEAPERPEQPGAPVESCINDQGSVVPAPGSCVGVPSGTQLFDYRSSMSDTDVHVINTDGAVIQNQRILGCVVINASNVVFANNYVECYASRDINNSASPYPGNNGPVSVRRGANNVTIEHNTLVCEKKHVDVAACDFGLYLHGEGAEARFNDLSGMVDGVDAAAGALIEFNYVHDFGLALEEWRGPAYGDQGRALYSHADGVQMYGNHGGATIRGNHFQGLSAEGGDRESGVQGFLAQGHSGESGRAGITVVNNTFAGYWTSLRVACMGGSDCAIADNTIDARYRNSSWTIAIQGSHGATTVTCNRYSDGSLVPSSNVQGGSADNSRC